MKKILFCALLCLSAALISTTAHAENVVSTVGTVTDTAKGNTTKTQTVFVGTADNGITIHYFLDHLTDSITGYASVWGSLDGVKYAPYPGIDSVAISAAVDVSKLWFINTYANRNPVKYIQIKTRCASNTTNATSKAKLTTKVLPYK